MMNNRGFTLIELMIVVVIIGILAGIALPTYKQHMYKARRSDAMAALQELQHAQEKLRGNCASYAQNLVSTATDCANGDLNFPTTSKEGWYALDITAGTATATGYTATATAVAAGRQYGDTECRILTLTVDPSNPGGKRDGTKDDGTNNPGYCW